MNNQEIANKILVRDYQESDAPYLSAIYFNTIHHINSRDYSLEQITAWALESSLRTDDWLKKWHKLPPIVAVLNHKIVGFTEV